MNEPSVQPPDPKNAEADQEIQQPGEHPQPDEQQVEAKPADEGILTVSADELELPTPTLAEPVISEDVAAEASLSEVEAETRAVQQQAEKAGTLAAGPTAKSGSDKEAVQQKIEAAASKARAEAATDEQES